MADVLGLAGVTPAVILRWYDAIVAAVAALSGQGQSGVPGGGVPGGDVPAGGTAGAEAFAQLRAAITAAAARGGADSLLAVAAARGDLAPGELASNAAVLMFGGIETVEAMICNAAWHLLSHPALVPAVAADEDLLAAAVEESLRLEPAAALLDRYAAADARLGGAEIRRGDRVTVSVTAAGTDPAVYPDPETFDPRRYAPAAAAAPGRAAAAAHLAFAVGPHFCIGAQLARLEAQTALRAVLALPGVRLDPDHPSRPQGLVFRKPLALRIRWDADPPGARP